MIVEEIVNAVDKFKANEISEEQLVNIVHKIIENLQRKIKNEQAIYNREKSGWVKNKTKVKKLILNKKWET